MTNAFITSAARASREQARVEKTETKPGEEKVLNIRIPAHLHKAAAMHRVETGENTTQLVTRLLAEELEK